MQYTTNYSLKKPQYADEADIEKINENTEAIDNLIHQNRTMIAPAFDNTKAYMTGDPVEYLGALYVFVADKAAGAWDASKVAPTTAAEMGGGGASALADLDDVEITSPTQGQALVYDDTDDTWKNATLPEPVDVVANPSASATVELEKLKVGSTVYSIEGESVTKTATGNSIELTDAASAPLVKCVTQITGYQEGTGTPSPDNIRPIVAYTEGEIEVRGKNILNPSAPIETFDLTGAGVYRYGASFEGNKTYTLINTTSSDGFYYRTPKADLSNRGTSAQILANSYATVTVPSDCILWLFTEIMSTWRTYVSDYAVIIGTDTTYEPYTSTTHTTTYPSAIYRGSEDVVNGKYRKIQVAKVFDGTETWVAEYDYNFYAPSGRGPGSNEASTIVCSHIVNQGIGGSSTDTSKMPSLFISPTGNVNVQRTDIEHTGAAMQAWCLAQYQNGTPFTVVYTINNPTDEDIAITNLPIRSLSGYTHIESSTGDMEIEYITKTYEPLVDLIERSDHIYSTQEQVVGTWVDGKTLYEKTLYLASASVSSGTPASMPSISGVETVMVMSGSCYDVNDQRYYPLPYIRATDSESLKIQAHVISGTLFATIFTAQSSEYSLNDIYVVVRYTKASSNRSLSAPVTSQKSISEPLTDKAEEVPTEEEKTVEKPETEEENNEAER